MTKMLSDPRYTLVLRTRHGAPQPLTPSTASEPRASSPPLFWQVYAYDYAGIQHVYTCYS